MITYKEFRKSICEYDDRTDQYVGDEIKRRKLAKVVVNATDDRRMITGKSNFTMPHHTGSSTIHVYLKKMSPSVVKYNYDLRFDSIKEAHSAAQQAAIAIDMKKKGKKPKNEAQGPCWDGYEMQGMKKKGDKMVPNCVPVGEENIEEKMFQQIQLYGQEQNHLQNLSSMYILQRMQMDGLQNGIKVKVEDGKKHNL